MSSTHNPVSRELIFVAQMTGQAECRGFDRIVSGVKSCLPQLIGWNGVNSVQGRPGFAAAVTSFTSHTIGDVEFRSSHGGRNIVRMTVQAQVRFMGIRQTEIGSHAL